MTTQAQLRKVCDVLDQIMGSIIADLAIARLTTKGVRFVENERPQAAFKDLHVDARNYLRGTIMRAIEGAGYHANPSRMRKVSQLFTKIKRRAR